jgi:hypothetical protein
MFDHLLQSCVFIAQVTHGPDHGFEQADDANSSGQQQIPVTGNGEE